MAKSEQTKNSNNTEIELTGRYNRFDLEQQIIRCWEIVEDIKRIKSEDAYVESLAVYYEEKFNLLWNIFDDLVATKQLK